MIDIDKINLYINNIFKNISFPTNPKELYAPLAYTIELGGKRLRPRLCLLSYSIFKDKINEEILSPCEALEVFHSFTLIHDDIMDKSNLRRGKETVWKKWDTDTAILSGDVMCIESYKRMAKCPASVLPEVLELFSKTTAEVCEGQQYDKDFESRDEVSMPEYINMIGLKTAVLLACSAKIGAIIAGANKDLCQKLYDYAYKMGLAFQIADDYLDIYGDEKLFGKPIGGDILNNKKTWLSIKSLEIADERQKKELKELFSINTQENTSVSPEEKIQRVKKIYKDLRIEELTKAEVEKLSQEAIKSIEEVCKGKDLEIMTAFVNNLVSRNK